MKRILALCLSLALMVGCVSAVAETAQQPSKLVVASSTEMSGVFFTDLWGNNTSDMDVRGLIHGYSTIAWMASGEYAVDATVVSDLSTSDSSYGYRIYEFTLNRNLQWNDGTPITAKDYVFSVLLQNSPQIAELDGNNQYMNYLRGHGDFSTGDSNIFAGVRLLGTYRFSLMVDSDYLPYFYELMLVNVTPYPLQAIAPGVDVADDGTGAYLTGDFTAELLRGTLLGDTGYIQNPTLTCGPYSLTSYDSEQKVAQFQKNPYYLGNYEGKIPEIEQLELRSITNEEMVPALTSGEVDIVNKVTDGTVITEMLALPEAEAVSSLNYLRAGFGFLAFACEDSATGDVAVRKAIAMSVDVDRICQEVFSGYALPVYGFYGLGQWMANSDTERLDALNVYGYDPAGATQLLIDNGWTRNELGGQFDSEADAVRYKDINGSLTPLTINWAKTAGSGAELLAEILTEASKTLGFQLNITEMTFAEMLTHYYRQTDREYNLFNMATNFHHVFDPYYTYNTADEFQGVYNTSGLRDDKLMKRAEEMRSVETGDVETYIERWFAFQERWGEVLPMVPLYSNVYFDFYRPDLYGYDINTYWGWAASILYATFTPPVETPEGTVVTP